MNWNHKIEVYVLGSTVVVQWSYEIAGEIASDAAKAMALAMSLT